MKNNTKNNNNKNINTDILISKKYGKYGVIKNNIIKSINDKRDYKHIILNNGLNVLLISDPTAQVSAASLSVNIGTYNNPNDFDGLAHFLEHMLFMGTKTYPDENKFMSYLNKHGGMSNAFTDDEQTIYYFDVQSSYFNNVLDIFAHFFIDPLFLEDSVDREIEAVNAEYIKNLNSDSWRLNQVFKLLIDGDHPHKKFSCGNLETLKKNNIREKLLEFYDKYYSANLMRLIVLDKKPIKDMEKNIEVFKLVTNKNILIKSPQLPFFNIPLNPTSNPYHKLVKIVPINDISTLSINWQITDVLKNSEYKPIQYISHLLGHESNGSMLYVLKKYGLATNLTVGVNDSNSYMGLFSINVYLTNKGEDNISQIIDVIYYYIDLISKDINNSNNIYDLYNERKYVSELMFKFLEKETPINYVRQLATEITGCKNIKYILYNNYYYRKFNDKIKQYINEYLDELKKYKSIIVLSSKKYKEVAINVEKYYGAKYIVYDTDHKKLDINVIEKNIVSLNDLIKSLHIIRPNKFIPEKVEIIKHKNTKQLYPSHIDKKGNIELWYKPDVKYNYPSVIMSVIIYLPPFLSSLAHSTSYNLYMNILNNHLTSEQYYIMLANSSLNFINKYDVLEINIMAYPNIIFEIASFVTQVFFNLEIDNDVFNTEKTEYKRHLINNKNIAPYLMCKKYFIEKNCYNIYSDNDILKYVDNITINNLINVRNTLINKCRVKTYIHGNISNNDAKKLTNIFDIFAKNNVNRQLSSEDYSIPPTFIKELGNSEEESYLKIIQNKHERNNAICIFYEIGNIKKNVTDDWMQKLLFVNITYNFLSEKFFNQLRTIEQIGYIVSCSIFVVGYIEEQMYGITFLVQSPNKFPDEIKIRIKQFISEQYDVLDKYNDGNFNELVKTTINSLTKNDDNIYDEFNRNLGKIIGGDYLFNIKNLYKSSTNLLSLKKYKEMYYNYMIDRSTRKIRMIKLYNQKSLKN